MTDGPLVSVLMTAYNREQYIAAAITSVLASTYKNFEIIIVDDRSTDTTVQVARSFAEKDSRVKVFVNETNLGDYPNRNRAASHASGKYLKYVDADDLIYPHGLEILVDSMEKFPNVSWGLCSLQQDNKQIFPFTLSPKEAYEYHYLGPTLFNKAPLSSIIKRDFFNQVGGFRPIRMAGDHDMWHRLAQKNPVVLIQGGIVWYRIHSSQEMSDYHKYKNIYRGIVRNYLLDPDCPLDKQTINKVFKYHKRQAFKDAIKSLVGYDLKGLKEEINFYKSLSTS